jgi:hypothetical protein
MIQAKVNIEFPASEPLPYVDFWVLQPSDHKNNFTNFPEGIGQNLIFHSNLRSQTGSYMLNKIGSTQNYANVNCYMSCQQDITQELPGGKITGKVKFDITMGSIILFTTQRKVQLICDGRLNRYLC